MKPIEVACAIIIKDKKILAAQRSEKMNLPLKWEFPGGKLNIGETEEQCLHRELKEELNVTVIIERRLEQVIYDYGTFKVRLVPFLVSFKYGQIQLLEHKAIRWLDKDHLYMLEWVPADIEILKQLDSINID